MPSSRPSVPAGRVTHYETVRQRKDGSLIDISLTVSPIYDDVGEIVGASKIARDISEQVRLRQLAREHAEITQKLSEVGVVVASSLDRDTIVQKVTDTARELTTADFGAFFYNVRDADVRRRLHALHAVGRAQGGLLDVPPSAGHRGVRAHLPRRGDRPARRRHGRPALRPEPAVSRHAAGAPAGAELSGRAGAGHAGRRPRRAVLRQLPRRRVHRAAPAARRRHRRVGDGRPRERPAAGRGPRRQPHEGRVPRGAVARAADAAERDRRLPSCCAAGCCPATSRRAASKPWSATPTG